MADGEELGDLIGGCIGLILLVAAVIVAVATLMSLGSIFGAGIAVQNYFLAFRDNVQPERVTP